MDVFNANPIPTWIYSIKSLKILEANTAAVSLYGFSNDEFKIKSLDHLNHPKETRKLSLIDDDTNDKYEFGVFMHQKKSGEILKIKLNGKRLLYSGQDCLLLVGNDITQNEAQKLSIKESNEQLKAVSSMAKIGYWQLDLINNTISCTDQVYQIWDRERGVSELKYENFLSTIFHKDLNLFKKEKEISLKGIKPFNHVHRIILPNKELRWVHQLGRLIKDKKGKSIAFEGTVQDITQQKEENQKSKILESVATKSTDAVMITGAEFLEEPGPRITFVNKAFTEMTGYNANEVIGKSPRMLQGPKSDRKELARLGRALKNRETCEITTINYKKNGDEFWVAFSVSPLLDEEGVCTHFIATQRDITQQKNLEYQKDLLSKISLCFAEEEAFSAAAKRMTYEMGIYGDFDLVELWCPNLELTEIQLTALYNKKKNRSSIIKNQKAFKKGVGLPGLVWQEEKTLIWNHQEVTTYFVRKKEAKKLNLNAVLGIPLRSQNKFEGILLVASSKGEALLNRFSENLKQITNFLGPEIYRKRLENDMSLIYNTIPGLLCVTDFKGRFLKINKAGCELFGYSEEEILNKSFIKFAFKKDLKNVKKQLKHLKKGEGDIQYESRFITKNGNTIWLSWNCHVDFNNKLIFASAKNINEEKKLKELTERSHKLAKIGTWEVDLEDSKVLWSKMVHELHETDANTYKPELVSAINFYREDYRDMVSSSIQNSIVTGSAFDFEAVIITQNLKERWVRAIGGVEKVNGVVKKLFGSFQNISEKKEYEVRLQSLTNNLPIVAFQYLIYPDGTDAFKMVSKGAEKIWGFTDEEVVKDKNLIWKQVELGGEIESIKQSISTSIQTKKQWTGRWRYVMPNGIVRILAGYGNPVFLADGTVLFNSLILDVTQESKNQERLRQTSSIAKIGSWEIEFIDEVAQKMYASSMTLEILELENTKVPNKFKEIKFSSNLRKLKFDKTIEKLISDQQEFDEEFIIITKTGEKKWVRCIGKGEWVNNKCTKIFGSFQDVNHTKKMSLLIKDILDSISDVFYAIDSNWNITYFNTEAERLFKRKANSLIGKNIWEEFPYFAGTNLEKIHREVATKLKPESFEYFNKNDNTWYLVNMYPSVEGVSVYIKNINDKKLADNSLKSALEEKALILESIGDAFFAVDEDWIVTYWNRKSEELLGIKKHEIINHNFWEIFSDAIDTDFYRQYFKAKETNTIITFQEYYSPIKKWFEVTVYPSENGLSAYFKDVTLERQHTTQLIEANDRFQKVADATNDIIYDWNIVNNTIFWGSGYYKVFGYPEDKVNSTIESWIDSIHPDDLKETDKSISSAIENPNIMHWNREYRYKKQDGSYAFIVDKGVFIRDQEQKAVRMVGAMTDLTNQKQQELELLELNESLKLHSLNLERSNEELEQFAFVTSHDLQEPLRMITSFMELLKRKYGDQLDEKGLQYIYYATDGAIRMKQIILDLLQYSRANKPTDDFENVNLNEILLEYSTLRRKLIEEKSAIIQSDDLPELRSYKALITQILHCLIDNALKYSKVDEPPIIEIRVTENTKEWQFQIKDNGLGIDDQFFNKIFVIFQRLHNQKEYAGTGIGLAIVKKSVEFLGGEIWLTSTVGVGTTFYFTLPKNDIEEN